MPVPDQTKVGHQALPPSSVEKGDKQGLFFGRNRENIDIFGDIVSPMPSEWFGRPGFGQEDPLLGDPSGPGPPDDLPNS